MTGTTKLAINDFQHADVVAARLESKPKVPMADLAPKANAVKPVRKNDRAHARVVGIFINNDVAVLRFRCIEMTVQCQYTDSCCAHEC